MAGIIQRRQIWAGESLRNRVGARTIGVSLGSVSYRSFGVGVGIGVDIGLKEMGCIEAGCLGFDEVVGRILAVEINFRSYRVAVNDSAKIKKEYIEFVTVYSFKDLIHIDFDSEFKEPK